MSRGEFILMRIVEEIAELKDRLKILEKHVTIRDEQMLELYEWKNQIIRILEREEE